MKKKILIGSFVVLTGAMVGLFAMSFSNNNKSNVNTVPVEQVSTTAIAQQQQIVRLQNVQALKNQTKQLYKFYQTIL